MVAQRPEFGHRLGAMDRQHPQHLVGWRIARSWWLRGIARVIDKPTMRAIRKRYVDLLEGQIHCHIADGGDPPVLFLHQTATSAASYDPLLRVLDLPNRLVAIDTPGFGGSFDPPGFPTLETYAAQVIATANALGIDRFHLFGHHTGAALGIAIAATAPERVCSLMMAGPVLLTDSERSDLATELTVPLAPRRDGGHLLENWGYAAQYNPHCDVELLHGEVVAMLRAWRGRPQAYAAVARHDTAALAARVTAPVLLLSSPGDYFHAMLPRAQAAFPHAQTAITGGGNFQPGADAPGVARAITAFLNSLD